VVKAAYEFRDGKNIATAIEVTEAEPRRATSAPPQGAPAPSSAPAMGAPQGSAAPSTDDPQTP